ncbi:hypothetical protein B0H17DRAFT_1142357 [Mycena rosella]|uniref:Uncharacterized protein n=1 Tax=Mycena rosella TaxID=1033263 RepID=A0AAD7CXY9_MYCRO|nr:hypothetical protein B0H17DRAFT_1142357 [Mycena rosella]
MSDRYLAELWSKYTISPKPLSRMQSLHQTCIALTKHFLEPSHIILVGGGFTLHCELAEPLSDVVPAMDHLLHLAAEYHSLREAPFIGMSELHILTTTTGFHVPATQNQIVLAWVTLVDRLETAMREVRGLCIGDPFDPRRRTWPSRIPEAIMKLDCSLCSKLPRGFVDSFGDPFLSKRCTHKVDVAPARALACAKSTILVPVLVFRTHEAGGRMTLTADLHSHPSRSTSSSSALPPSIAEAALPSPTCVARRDYRPSVKGMGAALDTKEGHPEQRQCADGASSGLLHSVAPTALSSVSSSTHAVKMAEIEGGLCASAKSFVNASDARRLTGKADSHQKDLVLLLSSAFPVAVLVADKDKVELGGLRDDRAAVVDQENMPFHVVKDTRTVESAANAGRGCLAPHVQSSAPGAIVAPATAAERGGLDENLQIQAESTALPQDSSLLTARCLVEVTTTPGTRSAPSKAREAHHTNTAAPVPGIRFKLRLRDFSIQVADVVPSQGVLKHLAPALGNEIAVKLGELKEMSSATELLDQEARTLQIPVSTTDSPPPDHSVATCDSFALEPGGFTQATHAPARNEFGGLEESHQELGRPDLETRTSDHTKPTTDSSEDDSVAACDTLVLRPAPAFVADGAVELGGRDESLLVQDQQRADTKRSNSLTCSQNSPRAAPTAALPPPLLIFRSEILLAMDFVFVNAIIRTFHISHLGHSLVGDVAPHMEWEREGIGTLTPNQFARTFGLTSWNFAWFHYGYENSTSEALDSERLETPYTSYGISSLIFQLLLSNFQLLPQNVAPLHHSGTFRLQAEHVLSVPQLAAPDGDTTESHSRTQESAAFGLAACCMHNTAPNPERLCTLGVFKLRHTRRFEGIRAGKEEYGLVERATIFLGAGFASQVEFHPRSPSFLALVSTLESPLRNARARDVYAQGRKPRVSSRMCRGANPVSPRVCAGAQTPRLLARLQFVRPHPAVLPASRLQHHPRMVRHAALSSTRTPPTSSSWVSKRRMEVGSYQRPGYPGSRNLQRAGKVATLRSLGTPELRVQLSNRCLLRKRKLEPPSDQGPFASNLPRVSCVLARASWVIRAARTPPTPSPWVSKWRLEREITRDPGIRSLGISSGRQHDTGSHSACKTCCYAHDHRGQFQCRSETLSMRIQIFLAPEPFPDGSWRRLQTRSLNGGLIVRDGPREASPFQIYCVAGLLTFYFNTPSALFSVGIPKVLPLARSHLATTSVGGNRGYYRERSDSVILTTWSGVGEAMEWRGRVLGVVMGPRWRRAQVLMMEWIRRGTPESKMDISGGRKAVQIFSFYILYPSSRVVTSRQPHYSAYLPPGQAYDDSPSVSYKKASHGRIALRTWDNHAHPPDERSLMPSAWLNRWDARVKQRQIFYRLSMCVGESVHPLSRWSYEILTRPPLSQILTNPITGGKSISICGGHCIRCLFMMDDLRPQFRLAKRSLINCIPVFLGITAGTNIGLYRHPYASPTFVSFSPGDDMSDFHLVSHIADQDSNCKGSICYTTGSQEFLGPDSLFIEEGEGRVIFILRRHAKQIARVVVLELV